MIYPENFEIKTGFHKIREIAKGYCYYDPGRAEIDKLDFSDDHEFNLIRLNQVEEFRQIIIQEVSFPESNFVDISIPLKKAEVVGNFLDEEEIFNIKRALDSVKAVLSFFKRDEKDLYPNLKLLSAEVNYYPLVIDRINSVINRHGKIRDSASKELLLIRKEIRNKEASISKKLHQVLEKARQNGLVDQDAALSIRNGRNVIPVPAVNKRKINGYVHDESATGKTAFIEPAEVVEVNNELRDLEIRERREKVRILTEMTDFLRPYLEGLQYAHIFLAKIDAVRARAKFAKDINAILPVIKKEPEVEWYEAFHPLLLLSFRKLKKEKEVVPLDIILNSRERILVISGPNAGGKSVCLQTLGLLQFMVQSGFLVPVRHGSVFGSFSSIFIDIGDEQSIENDLSTYSSHLLNMKYFTRNADEKTLVLIDEFGSGTEPLLGGAIAESVLEALNNSGVFGLLTTHYTNLKHYASSAEGIVNGAMLFDTHKMQPIYKLSIGKPGSSFAFEIARKIGLSEDILKHAEAKIGKEHVDFEKNLKDIIRDKKYWDNKRQRIRIAEKKLSELVSRYDSELSDTEKQRKNILNEAKQQANELLSSANKKIENTIREIKEAEAEKEKTKKVRSDLEEFKEKVRDEQKISLNDPRQDELRKKLNEVRQHSRRIEERKPVKSSPQVKKEKYDPQIHKGDQVIMKGQTVAGEVLEMKGNKAIVAFGDLKSQVALKNLDKIPPDKIKPISSRSTTRQDFGDWSPGRRKIFFRPEIDVRGKRAEEALKIINDFIDEAIMVQSGELRILHGKGNGILRELIRQLLGSMDVVEWYGDDHVDRGGAGIRVVKLGV